MLTAAASLFVTLLAITNPVGNAAIFISITQGMTRDELVKIALRTGIACFCVLIIAAFIGSPLLSSIGVSIDDFMFAGGLILIKVGFSMFSGETDKSNYNECEHESEMSSLAVVPLAIPLIAGPGAMVTVIHFMSSGTSVGNMFILTGVVFVNAVVITLCLYATTLKFFQRLIRKKSVIGMVTRICGLLIIAMASSMVLGALKTYIG